MRRLRAAGLLSLNGVREVPLARLQAVIRPAGFFRQKAARLKTFVAFVDQNYSGSLKRLFAQPTHKLRQQLLVLNGIGPETADSILLYAGQHPVFVVDAYTRRILERHGIAAPNLLYEEIRALCESALAVNSRGRHSAAEAVAHARVRIAAPCRASQKLVHPMAHLPSPMSQAERSPLAQVYNDMHGLIVNVGKHYCLKSKPHCEECPLQEFLPQIRP